MTSGRRASGFIVQSLDGSVSMDLPTMIECNDIPDERSEIPTPEVAQNYPHLKRIPSHIPLLDPDSDILLLIGRDIQKPTMY